MYNYSEKKNLKCDRIQSDDLRVKPWCLDVGGETKYDDAGAGLVIVFRVCWCLWNVVEGEDAGEWSSLLKGDLGGEVSGSGAWWNGLALFTEGATTDMT